MSLLYKPWFWHVNFWAAFLHLVNGILTLILFLENDGPEDFNLSEPYVKWIGDVDVEYDNSTRCVQRFGDQLISRGQEKISLYLHILIIAFHWLSFFFQIAVAYPDWRATGDSCCAKVDDFKSEGTDFGPCCRLGLAIEKIIVSLTLLPLGYILYAILWLLGWIPLFGYLPKTLLL